MKNTFKILTILLFFSNICLAQLFTVGKSSIQMIDKLSVPSSIYVAIYKTDNSLLSAQTILDNIQKPNSNILFSIQQNIIDTGQFIIKHSIPTVSTTSIKYWISYIVQTTQGPVIRYSAPFTITRKQVAESIVCNTYINPKIGTLYPPFKLNFLFYAPESYYHSNKKYPLIITCHGNGQKGTNNIDLLRSAFVPNKIDAGLNAEFVIISPQTNGYKPAWNSVGWYKEMIDSLAARYKNIDTSLIYIMGYSGGGEGVSTFVRNYKVQGIGTFAPVITLTVLEKCKLVNKKVWAYHCLDDKTISPNISINLIKHINACNPSPITKPKFTYYPTGGHAPWKVGLSTDSIFQYFLQK